MLNSEVIEIALDRGSRIAGLPLTHSVTLGLRFLISKMSVVGKIS